MHATYAIGFHTTVSYAVHNPAVSILLLSKLERAWAGIYAGEVGYFIDKTKGDCIVKLVSLRLRMY